MERRAGKPGLTLVAASAVGKGQVPEAGVAAGLAFLVSVEPPELDPLVLAALSPVVVLGLAVSDPLEPLSPLEVLDAALVLPRLSFL